MEGGREEGRGKENGSFGWEKAGCFEEGVGLRVIDSSSVGSQHGEGDCVLGEDEPRLEDKWVTQRHNGAPSKGFLCGI